MSIAASAPAYVTTSQNLLLLRQASKLSSAHTPFPATSASRPGQHLVCTARSWVNDQSPVGELFTQLEDCIHMLRPVIMQHHQLPVDFCSRRHLPS